MNIASPSSSEPEASIGKEASHVQDGTQVEKFDKDLAEVEHQNDDENEVDRGSEKQQHEQHEQDATNAQNKKKRRFPPPTLDTHRMGLEYTAQLELDAAYKRAIAGLYSLLTNHH